MTANPIASMTSDTLIIAEASADELRLTIEHLHTRLAFARAMNDAHLERIDAADQRARTLDAALTHEREAGRGLVAQVEALRAEALEHGSRLAMARHNSAVAERNKCDAEVAKLRAEVAELRARPVLTVERLTRALADAGLLTCGVEAAGIILAALGPVTLPPLDRAEELTAAFFKEMNLGKSDFQRQLKAMRAALAKLSPAPAREAAPTLVAVSDEELMHEFYTGAENGTRPVNGIRAVRAKLGAAEVTEERLARAVAAATPKSDPLDVRDLSRAIFANLRAATAKEHDRE
jgi:hypothetical protein